RSVKIPTRCPSPSTTGSDPMLFSTRQATASETVAPDSMVMTRRPLLDKTPRTCIAQLPRRGALAGSLRGERPAGLLLEGTSERGLSLHFTDYRALYDRKEIDLVVLGLPNDLHCEATVLAAEAGKHVVVEKPLALNLAECDRMIASCERSGVILGYAEELCFA